LKLPFKFTILFLLSIIFSNNNSIRCGLHEELSNPNGLRSRPDMDTYSVSPSGNFYIHYNLEGPDSPSQLDEDSNGIPDYVDEVGIASDFVENILVNTLNFLPIIHDDDQKYDIYIKDMGQGYYGVNYLDIDSLGNNTGSTYIFIDNEYEENEYYTTGIEAMKITVAHEYFHAIQRSYRTQFNSETLYLYEMSSTWIEDVIYPDIDDYIDSGWLFSFYNNPEQNISETDGYSIALYAHYLTSVIEGENNLESSIIKEIWQQFSIDNDAHSSINTILMNNYSTTFMNTWLDFCTRNLYNGYYDNMDNSFYYYNDQINAIPIIINNINDLTTSIEFINQSLEDDSIVIHAFEPSSDFFINIDNLNGNVLGNIVLEAEEIFGYPLIHTIPIEDLNYHYIENEIGKIYLFMGSDYDLSLNFELSVHPYEFGDINQNNFINVVDIIYIVNYIFSSIDLSEFQIVLADLNLDDIISVLDITGIINIIMEN